MMSEAHFVWTIQSFGSLVLRIISFPFLDISDLSLFFKQFRRKEEAAKDTLLLAGEEHRKPLLLSLLWISFYLFLNKFSFMCLKNPNFLGFSQSIYALLCCWKCKIFKGLYQLLCWFSSGKFTVFQLLAKKKKNLQFFWFLDFKDSSKNTLIIFSRKKCKWFLLFFKICFLRKWQ